MDRWNSTRRFINRNSKNTLMEKKGVILGGGESGIGTALLAQRKGFHVFVSDQNSLSSIAKTPYKKMQFCGKKTNTTWNR